MSAHTPGPWRISRNGGAVVADTPIPEMRGSDDTSYYGGHLICESVVDRNARLIASAPDLLSALEMTYLILERDGDEWRICDFLRDAIQKATGDKI